MSKYYKIVSYTPFKHEERTDYIVSDFYSEVCSYANECAEEHGDLMLSLYHEDEDPIWFLNNCGYWISEIEVKDFRKACEL